MHTGLCVAGLLLLKAVHHLGKDTLWHVPRSLGACGRERVGGVLLASSSASPLWRSSFGHLLELLGDFLQRAVDLELGSLAV